MKSKPVTAERRKLSFFGRLISNVDPTSSMRWVFVFTFILLNTTLWIVWASLSIANMTMMEIPTGLGFAYASALAVTTGGKVLQSRYDTQKEEILREEIPVNGGV